VLSNRLLIACALLGAVTGAAAQYPERPVRLIVPQAAGSATDTVARILAPEMSKPLGQPVVVENRPGGALTIGIDAVAKAAPDGYSIGMGPIGALAITRHMVAKLPYDIERDLQPVALVARGHLLLAVTPSLPVRSVRELIEHARKSPGKLVNASSSNGSPGHVAGELFKYMTGTSIVHVPYKGNAPALTDTLAGHVPFMFNAIITSLPHVRAGKLRALAVTSAKRSSLAPKLPTMSESGLELSMSAQDVGNAQETLDAKFEGTELTVAFNPMFLHEGVDAVDTEEVVLETVDPLKPATLHAADTDTFLYLLMPVRTS